MSIEDNSGRADTEDFFFAPFLAEIPPSVIATTSTVCSEIMQLNGTFHTLLLAKAALIIL